MSPDRFEMTTDLASYLTELDLDEHRDFLSSLARPSVEIVATDVPVFNGCSKFGGLPDLPGNFEWPHHKLGPCRFIGQLNLADIPQGPHGLPIGGLLSFFYAFDEDGASFWRDPDFIRAYRFTDVGALKPTEVPAAVRLGATRTVKFQLGVDVPSWPFKKSAKNWPISQSQRDDYWELRLRIHSSGQYLLGYPFNTTLAYDPTPGPEWRSLLTLSSNNQFEWCWHDGGRLVTFIEEQRLRVGDFSHIKADAG
jgi:uncharacterized protein YwqG